MLISELKWTKRARLAVVVLCVVLGTAGLVVLSQMNQVAEAAILTPIQSTPSPYTFYDDFSGDLSNWTIVSGMWTIEEGKLRCDVTDSVDVPHPIYVDTSLRNFVYEAKLRKISGHWAGLMFRGSSPPTVTGEYYLVILGNTYAGIDSYWVGKWSGGEWARLSGGWRHLTGLDVSIGAEVKVDFEGSTLAVSINGTQVYHGSDNFRSEGVFGFVASGHTANTQWYFDDANATGTGVSSIPTAYRLDVGAGVSQIVITCTWSGFGNITIANLTSPTTTYYETNMSIYERTTFSSEPSTFFNVKRGSLTIAAATSEETWTLNLDITSVTTFQVTAETS